MQVHTVSILICSNFITKTSTYIICTCVCKHCYAYQTTDLVPLLTKSQWIFMSALANRILIAKAVRGGAESLEGSHRMGDDRNELKISVPLTFIKTYKIDLLSARSISLDSAFYSIFKYFDNPALYFGKVWQALYTVQLSECSKLFSIQVPFPFWVSVNFRLRQRRRGVPQLLLLAHVFFL